MSGAFQPDPSWPTILELAIKLWGEPTDWSHDKNEVRFGTHQSKSIKIKEMLWFDNEANEGGGYVEIHKLAIGPLPQRPKVNGKGNGHAADRLKPWENVGTVYHYHDPDGALILDVVRSLDGRPRFFQRRPNGYTARGDQKWKWSVKDLPGHDSLIYRLPGVLSSGDQTIWICEGEKDVDNLTKLGLTATCNIGGAGKWRAEYVRYFHRKHIVVLVDNDEVGEAHAATVARSLHPVVASIKLLMLPGLLPKGDVSDWLADGGTRDELEYHAREAPPYVPTQEPVVAEEGDGRDPPDDPTLPEDDGRGGHDGGLVTEQQAMRTYVAMNKDVLRFNHSNGGWLLWTEHYWKPDERKLAFSWALNLCRQMAMDVRARDPSKARLVIEKVRFSAAVETGARAMPEVATAQTDWDADPMLLGTPGGIVDLTTGILRDGLPTDMISRTTSVTPSLMPDCPTWIGFLNYALNDDEQLVRYVQRYFGYCLTGVTIEEVFLFVFGPGGAGKGTTVETVASIMGDYASTVPMEVFTGKSWSPTEYYRASMAGQRLIVANEPERGAYWAEAFIKETTGGDTLSGRHPMGRPFRFKPSHKMALQGNHMPKLKGKSTGMQRRLNILPFTRKPVEPDQHLKAKLLAEGPAILRWLIEGCLAWQKIGLNPPNPVLAASHKYFEAQDVIVRWIEDRCDLNPQLAEEPSKLRANFNAWARLNGEDEINGNDFAEAIDQFEPPFTRKKSGSKRLVWGIGIRPSETNEDWRTN